MKYDKTIMYYDLIGEHSLRSKEYVFIDFLHRHNISIGPVNMKYAEIAKILRVEYRTTKRILAGLIKKGFVKKSQKGLMVVDSFAKEIESLDLARLKMDPNEENDCYFPPQEESRLLPIKQNTSRLLEVDIEDVVFNNSLNEVGRRSLKERGLHVYRFKPKRQLKIGTGSIVDLIYFDKEEGVIYCDILEIKKDDVDDKCLVQALRYMEVVNLNFESMDVEHCTRITLVGAQIKPSTYQIAKSIGINARFVKYTHSKLTGFKFFDMSDYGEQIVFDEECENLREIILDLKSQPND